MTVSSGFFNSVNHDRLYDAEQLSSIFDGIIIDGVYENVGDAFMITAYPDANNTVIVGTGRAWFDHTWTKNDSQYSLTIASPSVAFSRIDAIVLDVDKRKSIRKNSIQYIQGIIGEIAAKPSLIHEELHNQYPLAYITVPAGSDSVISQSQIENMVGTEECPVVTGILEAQNLDNLWAQLDSEFNEWWDGIRDILDENTVTMLQNQIDEINEKLENSASYGISKDSFEFAKTASIAQLAQLPLRTANYSFLPDGYILCVGGFVSSDRVNITGFDTSNTATVVGAVVLDRSGTIVSSLVLEPIYNYSLDHSSIPSNSVNYRIGAKIAPALLDFEGDSYPVSAMTLSVGTYLANSNVSTNDDYIRYRNGFDVRVHKISVSSNHQLSLVDTIDSEKKKFSDNGSSDTNNAIISLESHQSYNAYSTLIQAVNEEETTISSAVCIHRTPDKDGQDVFNVTGEYVYPFTYNKQTDLFTFPSRSNYIAANSSDQGGFQLRLNVAYTVGSTGAFCVYPVANSSKMNNVNSYILAKIGDCSYLNKSTYPVTSVLGSDHTKVNIRNNTGHYFNSKGQILKMSSNKLAPSSIKEMPPFIQVSFGFSSSTSGSVSGKSLTNGVLTPEGRIAVCSFGTDLSNPSTQASVVDGGNGIAIWSASSNVSIGGSYSSISNAMRVCNRIRDVYYDPESRLIMVLPVGFIGINTKDFNGSIVSNQFPFIPKLPSGNESTNATAIKITY